jgi:DNA-binding transcriptional ArsR family regulator
MAKTSKAKRSDGALKTSLPPKRLILTDLFGALSDPVRLEVVGLLYTRGECTCAELDGDRPKSTMSHHFRVLRSAGLVETRIDGVTHRNKLREAEIEKAFPLLLQAIMRATGVKRD